MTEVGTLTILAALWLGSGLVYALTTKVGE